jgi:ribonuclease HIII
MVSFREARRHSEHKQNTSRKGSDKKIQTIVINLVTSVENKTYRTHPKVYKILKQRRKDTKKRGKIQGNIHKNVFWVPVISKKTN